MVCSNHFLYGKTLKSRKIGKPGRTKPETTKPGNGDISLGLGNKVKDRVRVRVME